MPAKVKAASRPKATKPADPFPSFIPPCLAKLATSPPVGDVWVHEIKLDGYRLQALIHDGVVRLLTRTGLDWTPRFGAIAASLAKLPLQSAILDGEAVVEDERGVSSFVRLVDNLKAGRSNAIVFFAFDALYLNGRDLTELPLAQRKEQLAAALGQHKARRPDPLLAPIFPAMEHPS